MTKTDNPRSFAAPHARCQECPIRKMTPFRDNETAYALCTLIDALMTLFRVLKRGTNRGILILTLFAQSFQAHADEVEKVLFLVFESDEVVASNTRSGRFDRLKLHAKEHVRDYRVANATAVVITNQRIAAYGVYFGGWQSKRIKAGETLQSMDVEDYSATLVTSDRILNFSGKKGAWSEIRRRVQ